MAKKKKQELITRQNVTTVQINRLAKKALKNGIKHTPAKGYKFLKDLNIGSLFQTVSGRTRGVLISCDVNATVIITESHDKSELGKKLIASYTEVQEITKV
jgi:ornithine carbamoyltransferase